jgi:hypothetical protein
MPDYTWTLNTLLDYTTMIFLLLSSTNTVAVDVTADAAITIVTILSIFTDNFLSRFSDQWAEAGSSRISWLHLGHLQYPIRHSMHWNIANTDHCVPRPDWVEKWNDYLLGNACHCLFISCTNSTGRQVCLSVIRVGASNSYVNIITLTHKP